MRSCRRRYIRAVQAAHQSVQAKPLSNDWNPRTIETGLAKRLPVEKEIEGNVIKTIRIEKATPNISDTPPPSPSNVSILDMMKYGVRQATISQRLKELDLN